MRNLKHTTRERVRLQRDLLESWAEVDLAAAIEAALGEAWDRDGGDFDPSGPLLDVFSAGAGEESAGWLGHDSRAAVRRRDRDAAAGLDGGGGC